MILHWERALFLFGGVGAIVLAAALLGLFMEWMRERSDTVQTIFGILLIAAVFVAVLVMP
jgi:hypothetical protein